MIAGTLRERIAIQIRDDGQDAAGQPLESWTDQYEVWSEVLSKSGVEPYRAQQFAPEVTHQVTIRWIDGLTPMHRIQRDSGQLLDILSVNYPPRKMEPVIVMCKERIGSTV